MTTVSADLDEQGETTVIKEGCAEVYYPKHVFYNPVQEFNRDLTIAVIKQFSKLFESEQEALKLKKQAAKRNVSEVGGASEACHTEDGGEGKTRDGLMILEGLAASGLRSVRFGLEIPDVCRITANDFDKSAYELIQRNVAKNNLSHIVQPNYGDAAMVMHQNKKAYHVIDLDPYGSPAPFLDAAVQSVKDGGLLCITCTDTAVLCGRASETCMAKYGAVSMSAKFCHEMALRITLHCIQSHASRYSRYIVPLISISADFYVRVFVRVFTGQSKVKDVVSKLAMVYHCTSCGSYHLQALGTRTPTKGNNFKYGNAQGPSVPTKCGECNGTFHLGGPIWKDRLHDMEFVQSVVDAVNVNKEKFQTSSRIIGVLNVIMEELEDVPLYYVTDQLCGTLHCTSPNMLQIRSAILHAGYQVSLSHCIKNSIKTTAPPSVVWDIMRCWVKKNPISDKHKKDGTPVKAILDKPAQIEACFDIRQDANPKSRQQGLLRWQPNPEPEWGPKSKASRSLAKESQQDKRLRLQNKRKNEQPSAADKRQFECKKFKQGQCDRGDECCYMHTIDGEQTNDGEQMKKCSEN